MCLKKYSNVILFLGLLCFQSNIIASQQSDDAVVNSMLSCKPITPDVFKNYLPFSGKNIVLNRDSQGHFAKGDDAIDFEYLLKKPILIQNNVYLTGIYSSYLGDTTIEFYVFNAPLQKVKEVFQSVYQKDITVVRPFGKYVARKLTIHNGKTVIMCLSDYVHGIEPHKKHILN